MKINGIEITTLEQLKELFRKEERMITKTSDGWPVVYVANVSAYGNDDCMYGYEIKEGAYDAFYHHCGSALNFKIEDQEFEYKCSNLTGYGAPTEWHVKYHQDGEIISESKDDDGWPLLEYAEKRDVPVEIIKAAAWVAAKAWVQEKAK